MGTISSRAGLNSENLNEFTAAHQTADLMKRSEFKWVGGRVMVAGTTGRAGTYLLTWEGGGSGIPSVTGGKLQADGKTLVAGAGVLTIAWAHKPARANLVIAGHEPAEAFSREYIKYIEPAGGMRLMNWLRTNHSPVVRWADRCTVDAMQWSGPSGGPYEPWLEWAANAGKILWINVPDQADDDYVRNLAALCKMKLDGSRATLLVERSNEVWNPQFAQHKRSADRAAELKDALNLADDGDAGYLTMRYHVARTHAIAQLFAEEFSAAKVVLGCGLAKHRDAENALAWLARVRGPDAVSMLTGGLAIAPYFGSSLPAGWETWSAQQFADHALTSTRRLGTPTSNTTKAIVAYVATARRYGLTVSAYEHGLDFNQGTTNLANKVAAQRLPGVGQAVYENLKWLLGPGGLHLAFYYKERGLWNHSGVWGLENAAERYDGPKYEGWATAANELPLTPGDGGNPPPPSPSPTPPAQPAPTGLRIRKDGTRLRLAWDTVAGATYNVYRNDVRFTTSSDEIAFTQRVQSGRYHVTSVKDARESRPSNKVTWPPQ